MTHPQNILDCLALDRTLPLPLYSQLAECLKKVCSNFAPGTRLPAELEICQHLGCSRNIVRQALQLLTAEGFLERRRPAGTFIAARGHRKRILVIYSEQKDVCDFLIEVVGGIEKAAAEFNVELVKINFEFLRSGKIEERRRSILEMELDGILVVSSYYWGMERELEILKDIKIPVLMPCGVPSDSEITPFMVMYNDMRLPVYGAIRQLRAWGHRNIAAVSFEKTGIHSVRPEEFSTLVFQDEEHVHMVRHTGTTDPEIDEVVEYFLSLPEPPTAFLCHSDFYAVRIMDYLRMRKIRVPDDISVMSVFAHRGSEMLTPPLTTISLELAERGEAALRYLINGDLSQDLPRINSKLIFRDSVKILDQTL